MCWNEMKYAMVPYADLKAQYLSIKDEIDAAIARVVDTTSFILGSEVDAFEQEFAAYQQARHTIGVNSGTSALHLALLAAGVGPGDEVITVPFTFVATVAAILYAGAKPVYVDIDPVTFNMDPSLIERAITPRTKAILPVHLYGQPADMDRILEIARHHNLVVIEDAAQAHAAEYKGRRVGAIGDIGCFSFYPAKNLGAFGEGGAVTTNRDDFAAKIRSLRNWGQRDRYLYVDRGYNYRLEGMQGAILRVKLRHLDKWTEARRSRAKLYAKELAGTSLGIPQEMPYARHVYHVYSVRTEGRNALKQKLADRGIQTAAHYPLPIHLHDVYRDPAFPEGSLPHSEAAARQVLCLPVYPELSDDSVREVAAALKEN
jgi:dTDP-4-amino-4,6-dideoxygalactose transaminase